MDILILKGSPNRNGSSSLLADQFAKGAEEAGHTVKAVYVAYADIHPCTGCNSCGYAGPCTQKDGMQAIKEAVLNTDMLVLATPLYYFGMSAQLKICIDRFCAFNGQITSKHLKAALIASAWNDDDWTMTALESHYKTLCRYLEMKDQGMILGTGCGTVSMTRNSRFMQMAYEFGKKLK